MQQTFLKIFLHGNASTRSKCQLLSVELIVPKLRLHGDEAVFIQFDVHAIQLPIDKTLNNMNLAVFKSRIPTADLLPFGYQTPTVLSANSKRVGAIGKVFYIGIEPGLGIDLKKDEH